jgi:hypothetical protein
LTANTIIVLTHLSYGRQPQSLTHGRQPLYFGKWKMASISLPKDDDLNFMEIDNDLKFWENERQPQSLANGR